MSGYRLHFSFGRLRKSRWDISYEYVSGNKLGDNGITTWGLTYFAPFATDDRMIPHFKIGLGYGSTKTDYEIYDASTGDTRNRRYQFDFHAGLGLTYMLGTKLGIRGEAEYISRSWETLTGYYGDHEMEDTVTRLSVGLVYGF